MRLINDRELCKFHIGLWTYSLQCPYIFVRMREALFNFIPQFEAHHRLKTLVFNGIAKWATKEHINEPTKGTVKYASTYIVLHSRLIIIQNVTLCLLAVIIFSCCHLLVNADKKSFHFFYSLFVPSPFALSLFICLLMYFIYCLPFPVFVHSPSLPFPLPSSSLLSFAPTLPSPYPPLLSFSLLVKKKKNQQQKNTQP